jgi:hypothetical protein
MRIREDIKAEIQQALGRAIPDANDREFPGFYSQLEMERPELAAKMVGAIVDDPVEEALFPEQLLQVKTRSQARTITRSLFYRQDPYTREWHLAKGKVGMAALTSVTLLLAPMLLLSPGLANSSTAKPPKAQQVAVASPPKIVPKRVAPVEAAPLVPRRAPKLDTPPPEVPAAPAPVAEYVPPVPSPAVPAPTYVPPSPARVAAAPQPPGGLIFQKKRDEKSGDSVTMFRRSNLRAEAAPQGGGVGASSGGTGLMFKRGAQGAESVAQTGPGSEALVPGAIVPASLATGIVLAEGGQPVPVVARTDTGVTFIGTATLNTARRMEINFKEVVINNQSAGVSAQAFSSDGLPGVVVNVVDMAPSLFADLLRGTASGVSSYVKNLAAVTTTTLVPGAGAVSDRSAPPLGTSIAGALADLFSVPPEQKALIRVAQVDRGTSILVTVLSGLRPVTQNP